MQAFGEIPVLASNTRNKHKWLLSCNIPRLEEALPKNDNGKTRAEEAGESRNNQILPQNLFGRNASTTLSLIQNTSNQQFQRVFAQIWLLAELVAVVT